MNSKNQSNEDKSDNKAGNNDGKLSKEDLGKVSGGSGGRWWDDLSTWIRAPWREEDLREWRK